MKRLGTGVLCLWIGVAFLGVSAEARRGGGQHSSSPSRPLPVVPVVPVGPVGPVGPIVNDPRGQQSAPQTGFPCPSGHQSIAVDNEQVLRWKSSTANQFLARAHVEGKLIRLYPDHNGHTHFEIEIGTGAQDTLEIVYNQSFGVLPSLQTGMQVEACGDYITSTAQTGAYQASPDGAILHWVHRNPRPAGHDSGFVAINGVLYGQGNGDRGNNNNARFQLQALFPPFNESLDAALVE